MHKQPLAPGYIIPITKRRNQGVALITMLLVLAIVSTLCIQMLNSSRVEIKRLETVLRIEQASHLAFSGLQYAELILQRDGEADFKLNKNQQANGAVGLGQASPQPPPPGSQAAASAANAPAAAAGVDHLAEAWAQLEAPFEPEGGTLQLFISDEQGKFNVNALLDDSGKPNNKQIAVYRRLLQSLNLDVELANNLIDWQDADQSSRAYNTEDLAYLQMDLPYRAANQPLVHISELAAVIGYTPEVIATLAPLITVLPKSVPININTAAAQLLSAAMLGLDGDLVVAARQELEGGFLSTDEFMKHPLTAGLKPAEIDISVNSRYFLLGAQVQYYGFASGWQSLVERNIEQKPQQKSERVQLQALWSQRIPFWKLSITEPASAQDEDE